jgi:hypothetical protein
LGFLGKRAKLLIFKVVQGSSREFKGVGGSWRVNRERAGGGSGVRKKSDFVRGRLAGRICSKK